MDLIKERIKALAKAENIGPDKLAQKSDFNRDQWANVLYRKTKPTSEHISALVKIWPEYAYWLTTGQVIPEAGQISPEIEEKRRDSEKVGKVI
ncbi:MAG: DNA-binding protein [Gammaproteobacteria bacterium]|nr:DNA-binding protein [Gammaproteobacteria bacterium]MCW8839966.1 DNA-binding protein [Gammaproteobacteria bacterium]MCW8959331.1 DNA-binding protein [Gammaproteobacteria bacterium]MCW8993778.1 DNA-binding protein [Gammaproteobacteria bacterium]